MHMKSVFESSKDVSLLYAELDRVHQRLSPRLACLTPTHKDPDVHG